MVETNTLLSLGFALVANFTNIVSVPSRAVPQSTNDLEKYVVGSPQSPIDLYLMHKLGTCFWIHDGVVYSFESPGSLFRLQNLDLWDKFTGEPRLDSNQVLLLAESTIRRLARNGDPIGTTTPTVLHATPLSGGQPVPFYEITWPSRGQTGYDQAAKIEIDARHGQVVFLELLDKAFFDYEHAGYISNLVFKPDPKPKMQPRAISREYHPLPTTNQVRAAIAGWLAFCQKMGLDPGGNADVASVDWDRTFIYTNAAFSTQVPVCQIWFKDSACLESIGGVTIDHVSRDACFVGFWDDRPPEDWPRFKGKVEKKWEDLARSLEELLVRELKIRKKALARLRPEPLLVPPALGSEGLARCRVEWRPRSSLDRHTIPVFLAEFDLQTGELKSIAFTDATLLGWRDDSKRKE